MQLTKATFKEKILLSIILVVALALRLYNISFQSFWLDEIHTALDANQSFSELWKFLNSNAVHPPLFYLTEKLFFAIFGNNEFAARLPTALASTASIWAIFLLGKELYSVRLGLIVAALTCFNYFHIDYAQDARPYSFVFLFVCFSFLYFIKFLKKFDLQNALLFSLFSVLSLYFHYFGAFVLCSQILIAFIVWVQEHKYKKKFFINFSISGLVIFILYIIQVKHVVQMSEIKKIWIPKPSDAFFKELFSQFFGYSNLIYPLATLFLILGLIFLLGNAPKKEPTHKLDTFSFSALLLLLWIIITLFIPFVRSFLSVPVMVTRYFISVLPAVLLIVAYGFESIKFNTVKYFLIIFFCLLSFFDIGFVKEYYSTVRKSQFRELASFIMGHKSYPVIAPYSYIHQNYYLHKLGFEQPILNTAFDTYLKIVLQDSNRIPGFWFADAHNGAQPSEQVLKQLSAQYKRVTEVYLHDAWAMLFLNKKFEYSNFVYIDYSSLDTSSELNIYENRLIPLWNSIPITKNVSFKKGEYEICFIGKGTAVDSVFPHVNIAIDTNILSQFNTSANLDTNVFIIEIENDIDGELKIWMDNDSSNPENNEDRNLFIKSVLILRKDK